MVLSFPYEAICTVFCSDDIKLRMKKQGPSEVLQECINVELEFDYLCPNEGYIISVSNEDEKNFYKLNTYLYYKYYKYKFFFYYYVLGNNNQFY